MPGFSTLYTPLSLNMRGWDGEGFQLNFDQSANLDAEGIDAATPNMLAGSEGAGFLVISMYPGGG